MSDIIENNDHVRRRSEIQLFETDAAYNGLSDSIIHRNETHNSQTAGEGGWLFSTILISNVLCGNMQNSTKVGLFGIAFLICGMIVILLLNVIKIQPTPTPEDRKCVELNGTKTCYSKSTEPFLYFGTKTSYEVATANRTDIELQTKECTPKILYLFSRHATRYPDKDQINEMLENLPLLQRRIRNSSHSRNANLCDEDLEKLNVWSSVLKPEYDNKLSSSGQIEAMSLAQRLKKRFPSMLNRTYSSEVFTFEFTSRERSQTTAEFFAKGLFGNDFESVAVDGHTNDKVLQFHKDCQFLKKRCKDNTLDVREIKQFEKGPIMKKLVKSVSKRLGFKVFSEDVELMYKACAFGYALKTDDIWCAVFSSDELKVLEFGDDIDDYYKDAYGNAVNYQQACPVAKFIVDLFRSSNNTNENKVVLHFSHAGAIKKVYSMFGLHRDSKHLVADNMCSQNDRKWRSSLIAPFNSNIVLVLYQCGTVEKVVAFQNEKAVVLDGCPSELCPLEDFYAKYGTIAENCDIGRLCCTCCKE